MNSLQLFNLHWLCYAMTAPGDSGESYYYDAQTRTFFYTRPAGDGGGRAFFNMVDLEMDAAAALRLSEKLKMIDGPSSPVAEIPRVNVKDKVAIQLQFLSNFPGIIHEEDLRLAVEKQADTPGFVLDKMLKDDSPLHPMEPYWEDFKLNTLQYYLETYTGVTGIAARLIG